MKPRTTSIYLCLGNCELDKTAALAQCDQDEGDCNETCEELYCQ